MTKDKLKPLIKFILKEVEEHKFNTKLLDNWKQVSTVKSGRMAKKPWTCSHEER